LKESSTKVSAGTLGVVDILQLAGFDTTLRTKLVCHQHDRYPVDELRRNDWLELYQSYQVRPVSTKPIRSFPSVVFQELAQPSTVFIEFVVTALESTVRRLRSALGLRNGRAFPRTSMIWSAIHDSIIFVTV
jgi:hypothetical protein